MFTKNDIEMYNTYNWKPFTTQLPIQFVDILGTIAHRKSINFFKNVNIKNIWMNGKISDSADFLQYDIKDFTITTFCLVSKQTYSNEYPDYVIPLANIPLIVFGDDWKLAVCLKYYPHTISSSGVVSSSFSSTFPHSHTYMVTGNPKIDSPESEQNFMKLLALIKLTN